MQSNGSPLATQLVLVHRAITSALVKAIESLSEVSVEAPAASISTMDSFADAVEAHHRMEDELAFPSWKLLLPDAPYDVLAREHETIVRFLDDAVRSIASLKTAEEPAPDVSGALESLRSIRKVWHPHIGIEERYFAADAFDAVLGYDEQIRQATELLQYALSVGDDGRQAYTFLCDNLSEHDVLSLAGVSGMPKEREA